MNDAYSDLRIWAGTEDTRPKVDSFSAGYDEARYHVREMLKKTSAYPADPIPWANSPQWVLGFKAGLKHQHETPTALLAAGLGYAELHESIRTIAFQTGTEPIDIIDWLTNGGLAKMFLAHFEKPTNT